MPHPCYNHTCLTYGNIHAGFCIRHGQLCACLSALSLVQVSRGTYYHRTLLFKSVADLLGITSRLIRGEYGRAYNVIYTTEIYVVDVMHDPGRFCLVQDLEELTALPHNFFMFVRAQQ